MSETALLPWTPSRHNRLPPALYASTWPSAVLAMYTSPAASTDNPDGAITG